LVRCLAIIIEATLLNDNMAGATSDNVDDNKNLKKKQKEKSIIEH
jgi:hypothetical protein